MKLQKMTQAWFLFPDDPDKAKFEIKHLRAGETAQISDASSSRKFEFRKNENGDLEPVPIVETNQTSEREKTIIEAIIGWENILDQDGTILECNEENKLRLCRELGDSEFVAFFLFVQDCRKKLAEEIKKEEETREKNLKRGQSGSPESTE